VALKLLAVVEKHGLKVLFLAIARFRLDLSLAGGKVSPRFA
jgi:hypothetical protein